MGSCFPGFSTLQAPSAARGPKGGSLTVLCDYNSVWETHVKWWCRGAVWSSCKFIVRTTGSEQEVKKDRVSIKDNQKDQTFTVTMEQLREDDADVYWCGIEKSGPDLAVQVRVSVDPDSSPESSTTTPGPSISLSARTRASLTSQDTSDPRPHTQSLLSSVHFLLLVFLKVPLLLSMLGAALWVNRPHSGGERLNQLNDKNQ
ncbi:PREDICTED: CMRF35-like molecule 4 [Elephantulus edwardii]|uniref:CMRF35-like molecule 4 n=1 Tax=Elephantulus edwardii TaxID=28737 RepID=UPI0003F09B27|nr:PREDICTED: CMRF35-like molecule 4 [Elephantulus edwardii]